jgi:hypothetical protein
VEYRPGQAGLFAAVKTKLSLGALVLGIIAASVGVSATVRASERTADTSRQVGCVRPGEIVVRHDAEAVVTRRARGERPPYWGCLRSTQRRWRLDRHRYDDFFRIEALRGPFVATNAQFSNLPYSGTADDIIELRDLRTGSVRKVGDVGSPWFLVALVLRANGSLGFVVGQTADSRYLYACPIATCWTPSGHLAVDSIDNGRISHLRLVGSELHWTNAGVERSAPLD